MYGLSNGENIFDLRSKMLKSALKIQDQRLDQKFATSERKQQEKWSIIQIFHDNFSSLETNRKPSKVLLDASETHISLCEKIVAMKWIL